jgi:hypothetical protein
LGFTFAGFTVGGATAYTDNQGSTAQGFGTPTVTNSEDAGSLGVGTPGRLGERDVWTYGIGVTYNWDAWTIGFAWSGGQYYDLYGEGGDGELNVFRLEASYALGPGVNLDAAVGYDIWEADGSNCGSEAPGEFGGDCGQASSEGSEYDAWSIMTGFHIGF